MRDPALTRVVRKGYGVKTDDQRVRDRLSRAEGQLRGVIRMLDESRDCAAVVTQLMAVRSAVDKAAGELITSHVDDCVRKLPRESAREAVRRGVGLITLAR